MSGAWVFVCGPSGAGKDSVLEAARQLLSSRPDIVFARRMVTRAAQAGSDHDAVSEAVFLDLLASGGLSWHWQAHGYSYGIARRYERDVLAGCRVVVNGSREHVLGLAPAPGLRVVEVTANPQQVASRLIQRGRDSSSAVADRLARNGSFSGLQADMVIVNDGALTDAGRCLADYLSK
ncbi:MAG: phosphonate metabolism protein/1,5-bisphosphokinase (PRPP-forming) PhnN [Polaromonas sp.]|uniref:phosphonate metabolism protein/1,5-bisphosphokinase (PRPP-forming) PhnN n=1 Tax=Polaromonas sp. TaxID=1869339 RepID=UPI00272F39BB|nr:phosphonate metabolism protein/1,5-bisphosphokinase (PRPP-forming) PhnN [Polaromonas sp.]MDP1741372.1 phosphonate metabolism protein/1,5-bisphosphokinase (PRPP-forming) PhnN [Polaromonas sp.]MDP3355806.1 phosphonate metabolism protein/1,5-bisphosphokinase (PRPP-forming) PhnN [Polaromonas sp.]